MAGHCTPILLSLEKLEKVMLAVERARANDPSGYASTANANSSQRFAS